MKTVLLLRHAKSDWGDPGLADFDRPLAKRGLKDAPRMGEVLALFDAVPDVILSSPALRAKQTTELVAETCHYPKERIQWEESFYGSGNAAMIAALQNLPDKVVRVLLVGHNPATEETAAALLSARVEQAWSDDGAIRIPTAGLLCFGVNIASWSELQAGDATLYWFLIPKLVKAMR
ncbi:MAG: histidine phosphatase family protein [Anaerolineae bacterium]|nr:histidine phosphatase family protein [Anaerolineae bacterium]